MIYKVIATINLYKGQIVSHTKEFRSEKLAKEYIEIIKPFHFSNIKLIKEYMIQEVIEEWN